MPVKGLHPRPAANNHYKEGYEYVFKQHFLMLDCRATSACPINLPQLDTKKPGVLLSAAKQHDILGEEGSIEHRITGEEFHEM